ncbi:F0F1 ATP synthase subunit A [Mangrovitalea sediminis]|uniref:F0F1 ATP synthase subunit A n=1 Tax=Mangrovitalea sediminis TaxID=1982043 RepID=UPI000BE51284|nr:F0F1 ATP synthase subunit A [Mangrovitalea sediminis]
MNLSPDADVLWQWGPLKLNLTLLYTWLVMALLLLLARLATRNLSDDTRMSRWQNLLEVIVSALRDQIRDVGRQDPLPMLPFIGTLFLFIALSNLLAIVPGYYPPTASLSTTVALAICVFVAVPLFGIRRQGLGDYLRQYLKPSPFMLPFNLIGELSRTVALAVRLYGNVMSGAVIAAVLLGVIPLFFPVVMQALGLLTGMIQAYIFAVLATVYIASASTVHQKVDTSPPTPDSNTGDTP